MYTLTQKITPHLWFDNQAVQAAEFYSQVFDGDSSITGVSLISDTPSGDVVLVNFRLLGYEFLSINAGPAFKFNPSISFIVTFHPAQYTDASSALNELWDKLKGGCKILMPLGRYAFSERYGWLQDRYGVSWQLVLAKSEWCEQPLITPSLMFTQDVCGKAEQAMKFYTSVFRNARAGMVIQHETQQESPQQNGIQFEDFLLEGQRFAAMDSSRAHDFGFNEAVSLLVKCDTQDEVDYYWDNLCADPNGGQCGWLKDKFGLSWQILPRSMGDYLGGEDAQGRQRAMQAMLGMKKIDLAGLARAYQGN